MCLFATLWTEACQVPLSMGFFRQEYWSGLPFPHPGGLSNKGIKPASPLSPALAGSFLTTSTTWEAPAVLMKVQIGGERDLLYGQPLTSEDTGLH